MIGFAKRSVYPNLGLAERSGALFEVAPDIASLRLGWVNVYFLGEPGASHWVLVDSGPPGFASRIRLAAQERFGPGAKPAAIILTHGHFDHSGGLHQLLQHWNVTVFAHRMELPFLNGRCSYPPADPTVGGGIISWLSVFFPRKAIVLGSHVQPLPNDGKMPGLAGWRWIHTPGHTPGHVSLFREHDRALIAGDAFATLRQESFWAGLFQTPGFFGPPAYFTTDWQAARESAEHLAAMKPKLIGAGHGIPLRGEEMLSLFRNFAGHFDSIALPRKGRYLKHPVLAGNTGILSIPPAPENRFLRNLIWLGLIGGGAWLAANLVTRHRDKELRQGPKLENQ